MIRHRSRAPGWAVSSGLLCPLSRSSSPSRPAMRSIGDTAAMFPALSRVVSETSRTRSVLTGMVSGSSTMIAPKSPAKIWSATMPW